MPEYPINIKTRETALTNATTNNQPSANKGATLTNAELDQNFLNIKKSIDEISARYYVAHNTDGSIKTAYLQGDIHYVEDVSTTANQLQINSAGVITSLAAGVTLFVKVNTLNTGASTIQITNTATNPDTVLGGGAKSILKNKDVALTGGELKEDEIVIMNYDGSNWQVVGESAGILDNQTVGSLITFDSTGKPVVVAPGTAGQILTAVADAPPTFQTQSDFLKELNIIPTLPTTNKWYRMEHNLGYTPSICELVLICKAQDHESAHNYALNDRIKFHHEWAVSESHNNGSLASASYDSQYVTVNYLGAQDNNVGQLPVKWNNETSPSGDEGTAASEFKIHNVHSDFRLAAFVK